MELAEWLVIFNEKGVGPQIWLKYYDYQIKERTTDINELITNANLKKIKRLEALENKIADMKAHIDACLEQDIHIIYYGDDRYPAQLKELKDPPIFLYCKGNLDLLANIQLVAVVGTRENSTLGKIIAQKTVEFLSRHNFVIVSGLAIGIDAIAHQAALDNNAKTIAVLVDVHKVAPSQNNDLAERILANGGLLIAENPPNKPIYRFDFAKRDRIQAGFSKATFAIETSKNGGTMYAVNTSIELNRPVYVPDPVSANYTSLDLKEIEGTQFLISEGKAHPYTKADYERILTDLSQHLPS